MKNNSIKIGLVQLKVSKNQKLNLDHTADLVIKAAKMGAKVICLQELYKTIYFPQYKKISKDQFSESIPGESSNVFKEIAKKSGYRVYVSKLL